MDGRDKITLPVIVGPTASGKTALGIAVAQATDGEVVSCDSMQIYRGMPIATAQPTPEERAAVVHHMIDFAEPDEEYSVARYCQDAAKVIADIVRRGKTPVVVGGTGLYADSLMEGVRFSGGTNDPELRRALYERAETEGNEALLSELSAIDPVYAARLHSHDRKRIVRALELYYGDGVRMSDQLAASKSGGSVYDPIWIGITFADRQKLYDRIDRRVDGMVAAGLLEEARAALQKTPGTAAQAIGHKELLPYLRSEATLDECLDRLKQQTRRYAKRQLSWFRRNEKIHWLYADRTDDLTGEALAVIHERMKDA